MRHLVDSRRVGEVDALPARQHFRAITAHAEAVFRGVRSREAVQNGEQGDARRRIRHGVGILSAAGTAHGGSEKAQQKAQIANGVASSQLLSFVNGPAAELAVSG